MQRRRMGRHGLQVTDLCLGTMTFGLQCDEKTSFEILDAAAEAGLTFLDTADAYPLGGGLERVGRTEEIIGRWMAKRGNRDRIILASKCWAPMRRGPNGYGLSRQHIMDAIEGSLRRLDTDCIDLYQAHAFDPEVPIEESLRAFDDLQRAGKVRYVGCSNYPAWRLGEALAAAERLGVAGYASVQPRYNMLYREIETELLPLCRHRGLGVLVYNPLAGGMLSGKYRAGEVPREGTRFTLGNAAARYQDRYWHEVQLQAVERLQQAVTARGAELVTVAVAWVLAQPGVTSAIIGASRPEQLPANLAASDFDLDDELKALCDALWWSLPRQRVDEGYR